MNANIMQGNWMQLKGKVREQWGKLTNDDLDRIAGKRDQLVGRLTELYGKSKDEIERELSQFESRHVKSSTTSTTSERVHASV